jgi:hypothetical protein
MAPSHSSEYSNPGTTKAWWDRAQSIIGLDPARLDITTYESHSASKFNETDFPYLKIIWRNKNIGMFHIHEYVHKDRISKANELMGLGSQSEQALAENPTRKYLKAFINTVATSFRADNPKNVELGP